MAFLSLCQWAMLVDDSVEIDLVSLTSEVNDAQIALSNESIFKLYDFKPWELCCMGLKKFCL